MHLLRGETKRTKFAATFRGNFPVADSQTKGLTWSDREGAGVPARSDERRAAFTIEEGFKSLLAFEKYLSHSREPGTFPFILPDCHLFASPPLMNICKHAFSTARCCAVLLTWLACSAFGLAQAVPAGSIGGRIVDSVTGNYLD